MQGAKEFGVAAGGFGLLPADTADRAEEAGEGVTLILKKFPAALGPEVGCSDTEQTSLLLFNISPLLSECY